MEIEINGKKFEVQAESCTEKRTYRVGDRVKVLTKVCSESKACCGYNIEKRRSCDESRVWEYRLI